MIDVAAEMDEAEDTTEPKGIACPTCGCTYLVWRGEMVRGARRWGKRRVGAKHITRIRYCGHCAREIVTYEKIIGQVEE
jgi:hypothetical protein